ncbi:MAG: four helix bundle protein [Candidatus Brocadiae bacterium]|nr:four helix bundle protein [Candidatus Brocadiia bacterium]
MKEADVRKRAYDFALRIVRMCRALHEDRIGRILLSQLLRAGTAIGANIEEAQAGQSKKDFTHKMGIARKEAFETRYWLRLLKDSKVLPESRMADIIEESDEICKMLSAIVLSAKQQP